MANNCVIIIPAKLCNQIKLFSHDVELNNIGIFTFTSTFNFVHTHKNYGIRPPNISTNIGLFWDDFPICFVFPNVTHTHLLTSIVITFFWDFLNFAKPLISLQYYQIRNACNREAFYTVIIPSHVTLFIHGDITKTCTQNRCLTHQLTIHHNTCP